MKKITNYLTYYIAFFIGTTTYSLNFGDSSNWKIYLPLILFGMLTKLIIIENKKL